MEYNDVPKPTAGISKTLRSIAQEFSALLAGFKLAAILLTYFGIGSLAKWVIEQWYPFTRWLWENIFSYFNFPDITDVEKDALTAIVFFLPLGITAVVSWFRGRREENNPSMLVISGSLGLLFIYAICGNVINFVLENATIEVGILSKIAGAFREGFLPLLIALTANAVFMILSYRFGKSAFMIRLFRRLIDSYRQHPEYVGWRVFSFSVRYLPYLLQILAVLGILLFFSGIIFGVVEIASYIPIVAIVFVFVSVLLSIFHTPKKLMVAAGASLAFISAAYIYEVVHIAIRYIEDAVP